MKAKIELLSDLCTSAGDGQASIVDTEVCFDDFGLPFIPAKRLKGLLKESLIEVLEARVIRFEILVIVEALFNQGGFLLVMLI